MASVTVVVNPSAPPTVSDTMTSIDANSTDNPVTLDIDGEMIDSLQVVDTPSHGEATVSGGGIIYTPNPGFSGNDSFTYTATNAAGTSEVAMASIFVRTLLTIAPDMLLDGMVDTAYGPVTFTVDGGVGPYSFEQVGNLPEGLNFEDGTLSGMPTEAGDFDFRVYANDNGLSNPVGDYWDFSLTIKPQQATSCPTSWEWAWAATGVGTDSGTTSDGGVVSWPVEGTNRQVLFDNLEADALSSLTSSNPAVVEAGVGTPRGYARPRTPGSATLTAAFEDPACDPITLNVTIEVTEPPMTNDVTVTVDEGSADNPIELDIDGYGISAVAIASQPNNGTVTVSGTDVTYTPDADFSGTDSFTYSATNDAGTSEPGMVTINVEPTAEQPTVSWLFRPAGDVSASIDGAPISSGDPVPPGSVVDFLTQPRSEYTYTYAPTGCGIQYVSSDASGDLWRTTDVTEDCFVRFSVYLILIRPNAGTPGVPPDAVRGQSYNLQFTTTNGYGPFGDWSWSVDGALPAGLSLNEETGLLSGTPLETGTYRFDVTATNSAGHSSTEESYDLTVTEPSDNADLSRLDLSEGALTPGFDSQTTTYTASVPYETEAVTVTPTADDENATITVNGQTVGSGNQSPEILLSVGDTTIRVEVTAENGAATKTYIVHVTRAAPEITLGPDSLPGGSAGTPYHSMNITAEGGSAPYAFAVTAGELPAGLTLDSDGTLSGTPSETGDFTFTIEATDDAGFTGERQYTLTINAATITIAPEALPDGTGGVAYGPVPLTAEGGTEPYIFALADGDLPEGLDLAEDGTLSGTPTEAGSFDVTVAATDANDFTGARDYTLVIDAPEIAVTVPDLPDGEVNAEYGSASFTAEGGTEPYAFELASGELPEGMTLDSNGMLSGTPTEDGDFALTVRATDAYGFEGIAEPVTLTVEALNLPVAQNHTLEVMAGTSGTLDLTQGATGGPFTGAAIVSPPESEAGETRLERDGDAYLLHFAASGTFAGTASLSYTLANEDGTSEPATVTLTVIARPDPSLDPEVIGLIRAQTETAKRFANTQIGNFNQRLEQLHNEGEQRSNSIGVNVSVQQPTDNATAYADQEAPRDPALDSIGQVAPSPAENENPLLSQPAPDRFGDLAFWSGGFVNFGTNDDGAINLDHTLVGVSAGVDYRFTPQLTAGFGVGYGRDATDVGSNGTESRAEAFSLAAYGSYRPVPGFFIDGLAGYSTMSFDSERFVTATGEFAAGSRSGDQLFASLSAGYEYRNDGLLISPYGRLSGSHSTLDAFTESGAGMWNLIYGEQTIDTLSGTLGLRFAYDIPMEWGVLTPRGRLEYTHDFEGSSRASLGYADLGTLPYELDIEGFSRDHLAIGLGFDAQIGDNTTLGFDYSTAFGTNGDSQDHTFGLTLGMRF
ncbi:autotransporter domain-containing protein [Mesorhizobium sp. J18]|uniref:autotransporter domain-containing protein n=1 Tax=Mesorhizobium sp. J18 TaxID=935263 RepID=UPI001648D9E6|nr:autotransporter domain-containing protein [Mesorhizobium sp. J18]